VAQEVTRWVARGGPCHVGRTFAKGICFRAVAAVPASAPSCGRRAKPGSYRSAFRAVAAVPASAPSCGRRAKPGSYRSAFRSLDLSLTRRKPRFAILAPLVFHAGDMTRATPSGKRIEANTGAVGRTLVRAYRPTAPTASPPARVAAARQAAVSTESSTKRTAVSANTTFTPLPCRLRAVRHP